SGDLCFILFAKKFTSGPVVRRELGKGVGCELQSFVALNRIMCTLSRLRGLYFEVLLDYTSFGVCEFTCDSLTVELAWPNAKQNLNSLRAMMKANGMRGGLRKGGGRV